MNERKNKADLLRGQLVSLTDDELLNFKAFIRSGEAISGVTFEEPTEFVRRAGKAYLKSMPF